MTTPSSPSSRPTLWRAALGVACLGLGCLLLFAALAPLNARAEPGASDGPLIWQYECIACPHTFGDLTPQATQLDSQGNIHVIYGGEVLYHAQRSLTGWLVEVADPQVGVGRYAALAIDGADRLHAVYLDDNAHTLRYGVRTTGGWQFEPVDPATVFQSNPFPTIAVNAGGQPGITFYDPATDNLYYLSRTGDGWQKELVDSHAGQFAALALDGNGDPHLVYYGGPGSELRFAARQNGTWNLRTIDPQGSSPVGAALAIDAAGSAHVVAARLGEIVYYREGLDWRSERVTNACAALEFGGITTIPEACGMGLVMRLDAGANPHLAYVFRARLGSPYSNLSDMLRYAERTTGEWDVTPLNLAGSEPQLLLSAEGAPHILGIKNMQLAHHSLTWSGWQTEVVDSGSELGRASSLAIDPNNRIQVSSFVSTTTAYSYGLRQAEGWVFGPPRVVASYGSYYARERGRSVLSVSTSLWPHVAYWYDYRSGSMLTHNIVDLFGWYDDPTVPQVYGASPIFDQAADPTGAVHLVFDAYGLRYRKSGDRSSGTLIEDGVQVATLSLALDAELNPYVAYVDPARLALRYASVRDGRWFVGGVNNMRVLPDAEGAWSASIAVGPDGDLRIAYTSVEGEDDNRMTTVWLARSSSKGWRWIGVDHFPGIFPVQVDLAVDNRNQTHLAYYDGQATQLKYAIVEQGDALRRIVLDSEGDVGWNPSIALDVYGQPHISYYDASRKDLKHAYQVRPSNLLYLPLVRR